MGSIHQMASSIRNSPFLKKQKYLWRIIEPIWNYVYSLVTKSKGFKTQINGDSFNLSYEYGSRYNRSDKQVYEPVFYNAFVERIKPGMQVFDIGAHIGIFSLGAYLRTGHAGHIHAFEPAPETADILQQHININNWQQSISVFRGVMSNENGEMTFYSLDASMAASIARENVVDLNPENPSNTKEITVPSITLDEYCKQRNIIPDVIKIDVEGAELMVLQGAEETLRKHDVTILCEIHTLQIKNCGSTLNEFEKFVTTLGYKINPLDEINEHGTYHSVITKV